MALTFFRRITEPATRACPGLSSHSPCFLCEGCVDWWTHSRAPRCSSQGHITVWCPSCYPSTSSSCCSPTALGPKPGWSPCGRPLPCGAPYCALWGGAYKRSRPGVWHQRRRGTKTRIKAGQRTWICVTCGILSWPSVFSSVEVKRSTCSSTPM